MAQPTTYQRVTSASDYDASVGHVAAKFDGVDDAWTSATFTAGTLTSSMDCLIAVRRDSAAAMMCGGYLSSLSAYFGAAKAGEAGGQAAGISVNSVFVDGTQLAGSSSVTSDTLHIALTPGPWHILEFRGLGMSAWTNYNFGTFTGGWQLNGPLGEIQLFASGQDSNRDKARAQMAAYFGVTLP